MMRSWRMDRAGDEIEWGWKVSTLWGYWSNYNYYRPEQSPAFWLGVNLMLAFAYALMIALIVDRLMTWRRRRALTPPR